MASSSPSTLPERSFRRIEGERGVTSLIYSALADEHGTRSTGRHARPAPAPRLGRGGHSRNPGRENAEVHAEKCRRRNARELHVGLNGTSSSRTIGLLPVVQWIERVPPKRELQVRFLPGGPRPAPFLTCTATTPRPVPVVPHLPNAAMSLAAALIHAQYPAPMNPPRVRRPGRAPRPRASRLARRSSRYDRPTLRR